MKCATCVEFTPLGFNKLGSRGGTDGTVDRQVMSFKSYLNFASSIRIHPNVPYPNFSLSSPLYNAAFQTTEASSICIQEHLPLTITIHSCAHFCVVHFVLSRTDNSSTNVSWSSRTISLHNFLCSPIPSETSTLRRFSSPTPIAGVSSGQLGFNRKSLHYYSEQLFTIESVAC
jgi:hypothetical protein